MYINLYNEIKIDVYIMINIMLFFFLYVGKSSWTPFPLPRSSGKRRGNVGLYRL